MAIQYLQRYVRQECAGIARAVKSEQSFSFALAENVLLGKVDLIRSDGSSGVELVDFKTSRPRPAELEQVEWQLSLYGLGIETGLGLQVSRLEAHFLGKESGVLTWDAARREAARERLACVLGAIQAGQFPPNVNYCKQCDEYRAICPCAEVRRSLPTPP